MTQSNIPFARCSRCIMDTNDDPHISFDEQGVCSYCHFFEAEKKLFVKEGDEGNRLLIQTIQQIKEKKKKKKYDCLIGLSGGVDSSYVAYLAKQHGLRPLCVHFDNGWNSELAVMNIQNIVTKFNFDLYTYVIDWEEFKDLQLAYLRASVVDIEALTDHAIYGTLFKIAKEHDIQYILGGLNVATEGILPSHWTYNKKDYINIQQIHKKFGKRKLKTFPFLNREMKQFIKDSGVEFINYLNWVPFIKSEVKEVLKQEADWRDYGQKHGESIWTRFYQGYILPEKFGIDKRKAHLSSLICAGQISREEALLELQKPQYDVMQLKEDMAFVLKKLDLTEEEFEAIMKLPVQSHWDFGWEGSVFYYYPLLMPLRPIWNKLKKLKGLGQLNGI